MRASLRRPLLVTAACAALALLPPATAGAVPQTSIKLRGAPLQTLATCEADTRRQVGVAKVGQPVSATTTKRRSKRMILDRCEDGAWKRVKVLKYRRKGRRLVRRVRLPTDNDGDYRVRAGGSRTFLRVGLGELVDVPVSFRVRNVNRSNVPCVPDAGGETVTVRGHLTGPRTALRGTPPVNAGQDLDQGRPAATLYYHGLGYGEFFWRFRARPGRDYSAAMTRRGHVSVTIDRLGYGSSDALDGMRICYGSQATIAKEIIDQLKAGAYTIERGPKPRFHRVALAGHSAGAFIAEMTAYSFRDIDALVELGFSDTLFTPRAATTLNESASRCLLKPERQHGDSGPPNYGRFGYSDEDFAAAHFHNMDPAVAAEVLKRRTRDPCGDILSIPPSLVFNQLSVQFINIPILQLIGENDALFGVLGQGGIDLHQSRLVSSLDHEGHSIPNTGHAMTLGHSAPRVIELMDRWLSERGF